MINIERRQEVPLLLAGKKSWRSTGVLDTLFADFKGKCYLTGRDFDDLTDMKVDHFVTRSEDDALHYEWINLYPIHEKANKNRPKSTPSGDYLDPCNPGEDVEKDIIYLVEIGGGTLFKPLDERNLRAVNTAQLLTHVHRDLKGAIQKKHHEVVHAVAGWLNALLKGRTKEALEKELLLKMLLSRDSQFTMLMRSIEEVSDLPDDFFD